MTSPMPDYGINFSDESIVNYEAEYYAKNFMSRILADPNYDHDISASRLWIVNEENNYHLIDVSPDVYSMLESDYDLKSYYAAIIHTTGWAAPLDSEGEIDVAPSKHSKAKRVSLVVCVNDKSIVSVLSFSGSSEIDVDNGTATGALSDAILAFWERNRKQHD